MFLFFEKGKGAEFLAFLRDIVNPTIGMSNLIMYLETNNSYDSERSRKQKDMVTKMEKHCTH